MSDILLALQVLDNAPTVSRIDENLGSVPPWAFGEWMSDDEQVILMKYRPTPNIPQLRNPKFPLKSFLRPH